MKKIIKYVVCAFVACAPMTSHAFKIDTHVWVGQQVINDLEDDGKLNIKLGEQSVNIDVPADVKNAVLNNKSAFLMGNIGPDAVPDVVVGQTAVHPGVEDQNFINIGWRTNKWLEYLLSISKTDPVGKAFSYGYLGHAAADVMAHTYVNQYAGDIFRLTDGETLVEQRHIVLEGYIAKYTPPLTDRFGNSVNNSWRNIISQPAFTNFVKQNLIYNGTVQTEYKKVPTATHLVAYTEFRNGIDNLAERGIWHDIDVAVLQIVAAYFDVQLSSSEASSIVNNMQPVMKVVNGVIPDALQDSNRQFYTEADRFDKRVFKNLSAANERMKLAEQQLMTKHQSYRRKLLEIKNIPNCPKIPFAYTKCKWYGCYPAVKMVDDPVCKNTAQLIANSNELILNALDAIEDELVASNDNLRTSTIDAQRELVKAATSAQKIAESVFDFTQLFGQNVSPIQSYLRFWRGDVDTAMNAYVTATSQMMLNTMRPAVKFGVDGKPESAFTPLKTWFDCYHMRIIGLPSPISSCEFKTNVQALKDSIDKVMLLAEQATSVGSSIGIPGPIELKKLKDEYIQQLEQKLKDKIADKIEALLPEDIRQILLLLDQGADDAILGQYFTKAETEKATKGLVMIPDMADRVKAEMYLIEAQDPRYPLDKTKKISYFNPDQYAVAYNAVVLAKLALLDKIGFDQLAQMAGSIDYSNYFFSGDNLVAQAFASIDGDHQWMPVPPPYPNSLNIYLPVEYTYSSEVCKSPACLTGKGFVPWKGDMRNKLFRKLFKGPLSPGIDSPQAINKSTIVGQSYPYQPCASYPFPDGISDRTCMTMWLIPILHQMLH